MAEFLSRRAFLRSAATTAAAIGLAPRLAAAAIRPNIVLIMADDLGYGDVGCNGSNIPTPNTDALAKEGVNFTQFNATPLGSPSRAALMTGRYPVRVGVPGVLFPDSPDGLSLDEVTIPQSLRTAGYSTMAVGKWHLGSQPPYLPTNRGFDSYYGMPYSNDMYPFMLFQDTNPLRPADNDLLTADYTLVATD
ncbi:MAG: sulfatase-like hydrolase/transferase, partial [Alphaproteobacteria bacterium]|nr:sulfatase-like hydrolase/transferase [Alphaproteobacteria bacterium]